MQRNTVWDGGVRESRQALGSPKNDTQDHSGQSVSTGRQLPFLSLRAGLRQSLWELVFFGDVFLVESVSDR